MVSISVLSIETVVFIIKSVRLKHNAPGFVCSSLQRNHVLVPLPYHFASEKHLLGSVTWTDVPILYQGTESLLWIVYVKNGNVVLRLG